MRSLNLFLPEPISAAFKSAMQLGVKTYLARRQEIATEELVKEMARGRPWAIRDDRTAAMGLQYVRAFQEGAARLNLRLMAQAMCTEAAEPRFQHSEFRRHAESLAGLNYEEILLCARFVKIVRQLPPLTAASFKEEIQADRELRFNLWQDQLRSMEESPPWEDREAIPGTCSALLRTGWLRTVGSAKNGANFTPTKAFEAVAKMVEFEEAASAASKAGTTDPES